MASIRIANDQDDPYQNYAGGTPNFDEHIPNDDAAWPVKNGAPTSGGGSPDYDWQAHIDPRTRGGDGDRPGQPPPFYNPIPTTPPQQLSNGSDNESAIRQQYQNLFGRAPDANELRTDLENAAKYGLTSNGPTGGVLGGIAMRSNNVPGSGVPGTPPRQMPNYGDPRTATSVPANEWHAQGLNEIPSYQFNDPYSKLLEEIAQNQLKMLQNNNPQTQQLMDFLNKQFAQLSNSPGYTPDELAVLNTQAMEPIEAMRHASQQRELERTSRAGYLPTSGITLDQQRQIDTDSDRARTAASRDLGINAINRQGQQRQQAVQLGQLAMQIPQQQGAQALDVAGLLYQMPRQAMMDANAIVNGSSPQSVISPYIQLLQQQQNAAIYNQQQNDAWLEGIGDWLYKIFRNNG